MMEPGACVGHKRSVCVGRLCGMSRRLCWLGGGCGGMVRRTQAGGCLGRACVGRKKGASAEGEGTARICKQASMPAPRSA